MLAGLAHLVLFTTMSGAAAETPAPAPASRLRLTFSGTVAGLPGLRPGRRLAGALVGETADALLMRFDGSKSATSIPRSAVRRIEVSAGRTRRGPSILAGALAGGLVGAVVGSGVGGGHRNTQPPPRIEGCGMPLCGFEEWLAWELRNSSLGDGGGALVGAFVGVMLGGSIGSALAPERWRPAERPSVRVTAAPVRRGAKVALALRF